MRVQARASSPGRSRPIGRRSGRAATSGAQRADRHAGRAPRACCRGRAGQLDGLADRAGQVARRGARPQVPGQIEPPRQQRPGAAQPARGRGSAWYLSTELDDAAHDQLIAAALAAASLTPEVPGLPPGVEAVRRRAADGRSWLFLLNHTTEPATAPADGVDLLTGAETAGSVELPSGGVAVVREREADFS